eukprot:TRINITY_DN57815_c0_g1_i1.p1 TRINITY_DN57815_c0_g1~~TRINITY_DN57815_c0_g1_i1.p1  ORF type:complete len:223 (-),score=52.45 TRINITY_DN57815_c0_g1_i1:26-694(-)
MAHDDWDDHEFYETLANEELRIHVICPAGHKRPYSEMAADDLEGAKHAQEGKDQGTPSTAEALALEDDEEDENVQVILCEQRGPTGGDIDYYLNRMWDRPEEYAIVPVNDGAIVPCGGSDNGDGGDGQLAIVANEGLRRQNSTAEVVTTEESVERTLAQISFRMDTAEMADTQWRMAGANQQDFFNFNLTEPTLKLAAVQQIRLRLEALQRQKISSAGGQSL